MFVTTVGYGRVRGRARQYRYWQACLYKYAPRKRDGVLIAKLVSTIGVAYRSTKKAEAEARNYAESKGILYDSYVRHNKVAPTWIREIIRDEDSDVITLEIMGVYT